MVQYCTSIQLQDYKQILRPSSNALFQYRIEWSQDATADTITIYIASPGLLVKLIILNDSEKQGPCGEPVISLCSYHI